MSALFSLYLLLILHPFCVRAGFRKHGDGRCTYDQEQVTGVKAMLDQYDFTVGFKLCRDYCAGAGTACWGITWSQCRRTCTLHGMPKDLFAAAGSFDRYNPPVESSLDGCMIDAVAPTAGVFTAIGGVSIGEEPPTVMNSDGSCDAICLVHTMECSVRDNDHNIFVSTAGAQELKLLVPDVTLSPGRYTTGQCPAGFQGSVDLLCQLGTVVFPPGVTQQMKCNRDCAQGTIQALVSKDVVVVPPMAHGSFQDVPCPPGYGGPLRLRCFNGQYQYTDQKCGHDCPAGNLVQNGALLSYSPMPHRSTQSVACVPPYDGLISLQCTDSIVTLLSGNCLLSCPVGTADPVTGIVIPGSGPRVLHPLGLKWDYLDLVDKQHVLDYPVSVAMMHDEKRVANCPGQYKGKFEMHCYHGQIAIITIGVPCASNCNDLRKFDAGTFLMATPDAPSYNGTVSQFPCDETGTLINSTCARGRFMSDEMCYRNCMQQEVYREGMSLNLTDEVTHGTVIHRECQPGYSGQINMKCDDGWAYVSSFDCGQDCPASTFAQGGGIFVPFGAQKHQAEFTVQCPENLVGEIRMRCEFGNPGFVSGRCNPTTTTTTTTTRYLGCHNVTISVAYSTAQYESVANKSGHMLAMNVTDLPMWHQETVTCPAGLGGSFKVMCDVWGVYNESMQRQKWGLCDLMYRTGYFFNASSTERDLMVAYGCENRFSVYDALPGRVPRQGEFAPPLPPDWELSGTSANGMRVLQASPAPGEGAFLTGFDPEREQELISLWPARGGSAESSGARGLQPLADAGTMAQQQAFYQGGPYSTAAPIMSYGASSPGDRLRRLHHPPLPPGATLPPHEQTRHDMAATPQFSVASDDAFYIPRGNPEYRVAAYLNASTALYPPYNFDHAKRYGDQLYEPILEDNGNGTMVAVPQAGRGSQHHYPLDAALQPYFHLPRLIFAGGVTSCGQPCYQPLDFVHTDSRYVDGSYTYSFTSNVEHGQQVTHTCASSGNTVRFGCWDGVFVKLDDVEICYNKTMSVMFTFATTTTTTPPPTTEPPPLLLGMTRPPMITSDVATTTPDPLVLTEHFDFYSAQNFTPFTMEHMESKQMSCWNNFSHTDHYSANPLLLCYNGNVTFGARDFRASGGDAPISASNSPYSASSTQRVESLQSSVACGRNCPQDGFVFRVGVPSYYETLTSPGPEAGTVVQTQVVRNQYMGFTRNPFTQKFGHLANVKDSSEIFLEFFWGNQETAATTLTEHEWDPDDFPMEGYYDTQGYEKPTYVIDPSSGRAPLHPQFIMEFGYYRPVRMPGFDWRDEAEREPTFSLMRHGEKHARTCEDILGKVSPVGNVKLFTGTVSWECADGEVFVFAGCRRRCKEVGYRKVFPGGETLEIDENEGLYFDHAELVRTPCNETNRFSSGEGVERVCEDGTLRIGRLEIVLLLLEALHVANGVRIQTPRIVMHDTVDNVFPCPAYESLGTYRVECTNGIAKVRDFACKKHCLPTSDVGGVFRHDYIYHDTFHRGSCLSDNSTVSVGCSDGRVAIVSGDCGNACLSGEIQLNPDRPFDPRVQYPTFYHMQTLTLNCTGGAFGTAELFCMNSMVSLQNINCNAYCPVVFDLDTTLWVDTQVQDDFDSRNYGKLATGKRLNPGSLSRYSCPGGEALVRCENSGESVVQGVFALPCEIPIRLCGCCATSSVLPTASAVGGRWSRGVSGVLRHFAAAAAVAWWGAITVFATSRGTSWKR
eukprot:g6786.t1